MKVGIQVCLLILVFGAGWVSRGLFDFNAAEQNQIIFSKESVAVSPDLQQRNKQLETPSAATKSSDKVNSVADTVVAFEFDESLLQEFERLLFQNQISQVSKFIRQYSEQFGAGDIEILGAIFTTYALQVGLDNYQASFELMNIEAQLSSLDPYSPSSQFFDVLEKAHIDPQSALATFDELASYYQEQITSAQLAELESWLMISVEKNLRAKNDWQALENWYQALIARSSNPEHIYRRLAALYYDMDRNLDSLEVLDKLASYTRWNKQDEQLYQANKVAVVSDTVEAIALQRAGEHFIAKIRINDRVDASMLLDTGASISGLDQQFVASQGVSLSGRKIRLSTAGGRVESDLIRLESVTFGDNHFANLDVASIGLGGLSGQSNYQGLLGMDVLGRFKFYLDQRQAILYLRPNTSVDELPPEF